LYSTLRAGVCAQRRRREIDYSECRDGDGSGKNGSGGCAKITLLINHWSFVVSKFLAYLATLSFNLQGITAQ